ncbi:hypothetical protein AN189_14915 [Loktanella sp. 3ANDIMAR09]|uniref:head-tail connector protein n=1 Tax=Loktanella sp. 3ANDIMAR09 TaxID=1225657 RepID=UPI0006F27EF6|nr:hypothetical protein [Loktanella sp. 3ANDIMAR09]KQI67600.1 hypothetical protein AN189_14915 [Loktanella sp. 3ANDIMAR09]
MKILVHREPIATELPFNLDDLKAHIRVDGDEFNNELTNIGHAAAAELEQFAQIALLFQTIRVTIFDPPVQSGMSLPIGPAVQASTATVTADGVASTAFTIEAGQRPYLRWLTSFHDLPLPSRITVEYQAGFGSTADQVPRDLAQALLDQAALHFDGRSPMNARDLTMSPHMARIGARYRGVQV